jgi:hypothetical protein
MNYQKYLNAAGVPPMLHPSASAYLEQSAKAYSAARIPWLKATAWAVVGWLLLRGKVPFEAESLPERWRAYDNDTSINGDRGTWLWSADGYAELQPCPLDDSAIPLCYYAEGHHPRSRWARWVWLGWRNMASRAAFDAGPAVTPEMRPRLRQWGDLATDRGHPGVLVSELDGQWCIYAVEPAPLGLVVRRNVGVKLGLAVNGLRRRASLVNIKWSLIRAK